MDKLGIIAGNGSFPLEVAAGARRRGLEVVAVAHEAETRPELGALCGQITWIKVGELQKMIDAFRQAQITVAAMAGGISRARLRDSFAPDARAMAMLMRVGKLADDAVLRGVAAELEAEGIEIVDPVFLLDEAIARAGRIAGPEPADRQLLDLKLAFEILRALGGFDIGQAVAVRDGVVSAIEAIEGTDAALRRAAALSGKGLVIAKAAKPSQDLRFDRPAIGPQTIELLTEVNAAMIGIEAGSALILERERTVALANARGISIYGYE